MHPGGDSDRTRTEEPGAAAGREKTPPLNAVVTLFAGYAPTVVVGSAEQQAGLQTLLAGATVDFVTRATGCLPVAMGLVERRLRRGQGWRNARMARPLETEDLFDDLFGTSIDGLGHTLRFYSVNYKNPEIFERLFQIIQKCSL